MHPSPLPGTAAPTRPPATSRRSWMTVESVSRSSSPFMPSNAAIYQTFTTARNFPDFARGISEVYRIESLISPFK